MSIQFNEIPLNLRTPGVFAEFDSSRAVSGVSIQPHDALLIGQKTSSGTATSGDVYAVRSKDEAVQLFGKGSQLAQMVASYKKVDSLSPVYCIGLSDNGSGVAATGSIEASGTATRAGQSVIRIGGRRIPVAITVGMTGATWETAALAALALYDEDLPVSYAGDTDTDAEGADEDEDKILFTAKNDGTPGNQIFLGVDIMEDEATPAGLTFVVTAMSGGATDSDYAAAVTAMAEDQYHTIAIAAQDATNVGLLVTELTSRWGAMRSIEGVCFISKYDTSANLTTYGNGFNSQCLVAVGAEKSAALPLPWETAAMTAAISAVQAQVDPAVAMLGKSYAGAFAAHRGGRFTRAERNTLLTDGISTVRASSDGRLVTDRLITTYQTNALSAPDTAYLDLYLVRTLAAMRYSLRARVATKFANFKLADDGNEITGQNILTPRILKSEILALFLDWQDLGWVENFEQFKAELLVQRNGSDPNRIDAILPPDIINAFMVGAFRIAFQR